MPESLTAPAPPMTAEARAYLLPLSIVAVLDAIVWDRSEVFFLGLYASSADIAYYSLAFGLAVRIMIIPGIVVGALLPAFSALHGQGEPEEFGRLYRTALRYVGLAGVPLAALLAALAPGLVVWLYGERGTGALLILSQVILSLQLPFAVFPLVMFTADPAKMGQFATPMWMRSLAWVVAVTIGLLNVWLLYQTFVGI